MPIFYPGLTHQIGGNTAGATANISSGTYVLAGGNNVTLSQDANTITVSVGPYITTAMASNRGSDFVQATAAFAGTSASGTIGSNGISVSIGPYLTTAMASNRGTDFVQAAAAFAGTSASGTIASGGISVSIAPYITTAALSQDSSKYAGVNGAITGGSITVNTSGVSVNLPAYLTTAALSQDSSKYAFTGFTTTTIAGAVVAGTHDTAGLKLAVPAYLTTAALSAGTSNYAGVGESVGTVAGTDLALTVNTDGVSILYPKWITTAMASNKGSDFVAATAAFAGTNASGTIASNGISVSVAAPGGGNALTVQDAATTLAVTKLIFSNANSITFGLATAASIATVTASGAFLTTAALSQDSSKYAGINGAITGGSITVNTSGVSVNLPAYLTTAMASNRGTDFVQATAAFAGTNASGTIASGGISVSVAAPGGAATYTNGFEPYLFPPSMQSTTSTGSLSQLHLQYFSLPVALSFGQINVVGSASVLNTGAGDTISYRLTNNQGITYSAVYTISNSNFIDLFLFSRGSGSFSTELETFASTRNSYVTLHSLTYGFTINHSTSASGTGSWSVRDSQSMIISYPMITSGQTINGATSHTTWRMGYTTWNSTASTSASSTFSATTVNLTTSLATTHPGTTAWSSYKLMPMGFATALTPGEYWLGMVRYSSTSSSSTFGSTITAAGTGASYSVTYNASLLTRTQNNTYLGVTNTIVSSLGMLGFASQATMAFAPGHGSFSGTWASNTTYLNNAGNPAGAVALSQVLSNAANFNTWLQFASNRI